MPAAPSPIDLKYGFTGYHKFLDPDGYPAVVPPWGTLNAINLNTGDYAWKVPLGEYPELAARGMADTGSENYGGPIVTAGGLLFIGATNFDRKFRAFDKDTGALLWQTTLINSANATPATYEVRAGACEDPAFGGSARRRRPVDGCGTGRAGGGQGGRGRSGRARMSAPATRRAAPSWRSRCDDDPAAQAVAARRTRDEHQRRTPTTKTKDEQELRRLGD